MPFDYPWNCHFSLFTAAFLYLSFDGGHFLKIIRRKGQAPVAPVSTAIKIKKALDLKIRGGSKEPPRNGII